MAQTLKQRAGNDKYAKAESLKRGRPQTLASKVKEKSPISMFWLVLLLVALAGGAVVQLLQLFF